MAETSGKKTSASRNGSTQRKTTQKSSGTSRSGENRRSGSKKRNVSKQESALYHEIGLLVVLVCMLFLFLCNLGLIGPVGKVIRGVMFGLFGLPAYVVPILFSIAIAYWHGTGGDRVAVRKIIAGALLCVMAGVVCDLIAKISASMEAYDVKEMYNVCSALRKGGGVIAGSVCYFLHFYLDTVGTVLLVILFTIIGLILLTEKSFLEMVRNQGNRVREFSREDAEYRREQALLRRQAREEQRAREAELELERNRRRAEEKAAREAAAVPAPEREVRTVREEERKLKTERRDAERTLRMDRRVSGVMDNPIVTKPETASGKKKLSDMHEIMLVEDGGEAGDYPSDRTELLPSKEESSDSKQPQVSPVDFSKVRIRSAHQMTMSEVQAGESEEDPVEVPEVNPPRNVGILHPISPGKTATAITGEALREALATDKKPARAVVGSEIKIHKEGVKEEASSTAPEKPKAVIPPSQMEKEIAQAEKKVPQKYIFPPLSRLQKGVTSTVDTTDELRETAMRLQQTLNTFGVRVTITDISQGPSVTRYELQPEQGVKVSKIVGLADDIKLNLAATDIRIEAPIPGKAAIGIEVPNKENLPVALRDLLETREFRDFPSNLAFAVGKDIAGQVVVTDIAKMPHMLIAGATGSGKSVCINTIIMSILYKAHPDDVKLIMIDPKVVELSVYNGIPHLLIPVVTDPKKASAALHWGVSEMEDRYRKFADYNVRDLKGYNKKIESMQESGEPDCPKKLPQIVIIVDELADLMMVCSGEVEESICRLAQLARAAGIHLIIATQRPSVDVITGLIKTNMPSRVAFSVASGVDSRTILDMNGAEKLLGKGDMLFYPQGYSKPARIQGAFVSDKEVSDVVDFLKNQTIGNVYAEDIQAKINSGAVGGGGVGGESESELDELFEKAGRFIIEKDKASIGMLQRVLKIGFNRAARIMDQLCEYGVVGEEEGTKPRKILMSPEQFDQLLEEIL